MAFRENKKKQLNQIKIKKLAELLAIMQFLKIQEPLKKRTCNLRYGEVVNFPLRHE